MANWFVDFSAANDGDGTSHAQAGAPAGVGAYNTLASKSFASGDLVWIRRSTTLTITAQLTLSQGGAIYIGWPVSGDQYFSTRPAAAQASWDGDAAGFAIITATTNFATFVSIATNHDQEFHRIKFFCNYTGTSAMDCLSIAARAKFFICHIEHAGAATAAAQRNLLIAANCTFKNTIITFSGANTHASSFNILMATASTVAQFLTCPISITSASATLTLSSTTATNSTYFMNCTLTTAGTAGINTMVILGTLADTYMYNCTVDSDCTAAQVQIGFAANTAKFQAIKLTMNKGRKIQTPLGSIIHFTKFNQTVASSDYAIATNNGSRISGGNVNFAFNNTSGDIQPSTGTIITLQNSAFTSITPLGVNPGDFPGVWLTDYNGILGHFRFIGPRGEVNTSNVNRSSGASYSLKLDMSSGTAGTDPFFKHLNVVLPGEEPMYAYVTAVASVVTIYGAYKGYGASPPTREDLWFDAEYLSASSGGLRTQATSQEVGYPAAALTSDASTWTGDSSLTKFKMAISMNPGQASVVPIRLYLAKRVNGAYVYIDPLPVVS